MYSTLTAFMTALAVSAFGAPALAIGARKFGIVDHPDNHRKLHARAVPLVGGPMILLSGIAGLAVAYLADPHVLNERRGDAAFLNALLVASLIIVALGLIDDRFGIRGRQKLAGQLVAALVMLAADITISRITVFGTVIEFGHFAPIITICWILGAINALNLIDGVDGLASTTGVILSLSIAAVTVILDGRHDGLLVALILAGSLCGFLVHNFPPARMFLGDSGSMLIGLVLGTVALKSSIKSVGAAALIMPTAIWAIPIFDVSMAIVRRKLTGRSIYATDRGHLHHCLERKGHGGSRLLLVVGSLCALTGLGAVAGSAMQNEALTIVVVVMAISLLILTRSFGHSEMGLVRNRILHIAGSIVGHSHNDDGLNDEQVHLNGNHDWQRLWVTLTDFAARFEMDRVELLVNVPSVGEEYHAIWRRDSSAEQYEAWKSEIPLIVEGLQVGHIRVEGAVGSGSICRWMSEMIGGLQAFEDELVVLIRELQTKNTDEAVTSMPVGHSAGMY